MRGKFLHAILALFILATFSAWRTEAQSAARVEAATAEAAAPEAAPAAATTAQPAAEKPPPSVQEILVRFVDAAGGREVWSKFNTRWLKGIYQTEDASSFAAIEIFSKSPNKAYTKITFPNGLTLREVCDGKPRGSKTRGEIFTK